MQVLSRKIISVLVGTFIFITFIQPFFCFTVLVYSETEIEFTPDNRFEIPSNNSSITFSTNGTYEMASLENGIWIFESLHFVNSQVQEKINLKVSATNSDVTINFYVVYNRTFDGETVKRAILRYSIFGSGTQVFDLGLDSKAGQLDAVLDGEWVGKNHGWTHSSDGTFTITGASENVTLLYYGYPASEGANENVFDNHSVVLASTFSAGIVILLALFITRRKELK
jgi:hypothetical protein